jgi:hypothetical protein
MWQQQIGRNVIKRRGVRTRDWEHNRIGTDVHREEQTVDRIKQGNATERIY